MILFLHERHLSVILETSQGGFHHQKEPVLASREKGAKLDPYMFLKFPNLLKIIPRDLKMLLKSSAFAQNHPKVKINDMENWFYKLCGDQLGLFNMKNT